MARELNWIKPNDYSFNTFLLFDTWIIEYFLGLNHYSQGNYADANYRKHLGIALKYNPVLRWYFQEKCPEAGTRINELVENAPDHLPQTVVRESELHIIKAEETFIVYAYPEIMEQCDYIRQWKPDKLFALADFKDKIVLDIGSGTGRLAFSIIKEAAYVYALEPVVRLREYMLQKRDKLNIRNMKITDGIITDIPYPDNTFDIVMSGHVIGDDYENEYKEMERVVKNGGYIISCIGEDNGKRKVDEGMVKLGFEYI
jgi:2-polyprenyl-3-methyl-5-hydroxy-6-metoxy-1,4-benzoquinol methylase